jgi:RecG-like helicase
MCSDIKMDNNDREVHVIDDLEVIQHEQRDKEILKLILKRFRYKEIDEEKLFEMIIQTLNDNSININIFLDFIYNVLDMPYADLIYLKVILKFMNDRLKLFELFGPQNNEDQDVLNDFIEYLIKNNFDFFSKIIDLILCYQNTTFREAMLYFVDENKSNFESLITVQNLNKLKDFLRKKKNILKEVETVTKNTEPTYYDFLVVQNETIKAQEHIKEEYITKITELENKNKELESSLEHFKEISTSLEEELTDYQDNYVKEISRLLDDTKKENDVLQKEILKLRDELCRNKRTR